MILMISENDQIIGADDEFLGGDTLENLKTTFPSMQVFSLQTGNDEFEFELNGKDYIVKKLKIILDNGPANIYQFNNEYSAKINSTDTNVMQNLEIEEVKIESPEKSDKLSIDNNSLNLDANSLSFEQIASEPIQELSIDDTPNETPTQELSFDDNLLGNDLLNADNNSLTLDSTPEPIQELSIDDTPNETPTQELSFGDNLLGDDLLNSNNNSLTLDSTPEPIQELSIDDTPKIDIDNGLTIEIDSEPSLDLEISDETPIQESSTNELDISNDLSLDLGIEENKNDDMPSLDFGFDNMEESSEHIDIEISKDDIKIELDNASKELSIDMDTIQTFFKDFIQQIFDEKDIFFNAITNNDYDTLHKSAHKLKGVALNLRVNKFASLFKSIDDLAKEHKNIKTIDNILNNLYQVLEDLEQSSNNGLTINKVIADDEKLMLLNAFNQFLDTIKQKDAQTIKKELLNSYQLIPIEKIKKVQELNKDNEIINFVISLQEQIKKELR